MCAAEYALTRRVNPPVFMTGYHLISRYETGIRLESRFVFHSLSDFAVNGTETVESSGVGVGILVHIREITLCHHHQ
jgi:hypothetical protein